MARWLKELGVIAGVAAVSAVVVPRVMLAWVPRPARVVRATSVQHPDATEHTLASPGVISFDDPVVRGPVSPPPSLPPTPVALAAPGIVVRTAQAATLPPSATRRSSGILSRAGGRWRLDLRSVSQPRSVLSGVRLQPPEVRDGAVSEGYRVLAGDRLGLFDTVGIRPGDTLVAVNGMPLRNPDEALEVYARTRRESTFNLQFVRHGARYTVPVEVVGRPDVR